MSSPHSISRLPPKTVAKPDFEHLSYIARLEMPPPTAVTANRKKGEIPLEFAWEAKVLLGKRGRFPK
jgi:hypothetical protein